MDWGLLTAKQHCQQLGLIGNVGNHCFLGIDI